ncbi:hypothetical protein [Nocardia aurea]|uniref:DUF222 domain-containing protein n=1 Tax=Nocardia aurea TaxID=2144174 RepID=A0ABV3FPZ8_9NOCA
MGRSRYPTGDELRRNFERELESVTSGGGLRSETGLDVDTDAALIEIAKAYPNIPDALVGAARTAFAGQLDGTNAAARRDRLQRMLIEHNRREQGDATS